MTARALPPRASSAGSCSSPASSRDRSAARSPAAPDPGGDSSSRGSLVAASAGALLLASSGPLWVAGIGALALGLAAGLPFAAIFDAAQRIRPDAPGAAIALVNGCAVLTILVGTPLAGLAFELPGEGAVAFAVIGALVATSLFALPRARL